jgi:hypothetical protein
MRRRLLNQTRGDPASEAIESATARRLGDVARLHFQQPEIVSRRDRERVTEELNEAIEAGQPIRRKQNGGAGKGFQGPNSGMSQQAGVSPPSPPAPRPKLRLKGLGE